jgi:uncharacterized membrane protein HdeD (DUF308 family)
VQSTARFFVGSWWLVLLRGILAVLFGVLALAHPLAAMVAIVALFGVWAFIDGATALALVISGWHSWRLAVAGLAGIAVALLTLFRPGLTAVGLYAAVAFWAIARGLLEITVAIELRHQIKGELWLILGAVSSLIFGVLMIAMPLAGVLALAWIVGVYALVFGLLMIGLSFRLHRLARPAAPIATPHVV